MTTSPPSPALAFLAVGALAELPPDPPGNQAASGQMWQGGPSTTPRRFTMPAGLDLARFRSHPRVRNVPEGDIRGANSNTDRNIQ
jgi:hypothetical protein